MEPRQALARAAAVPSTLPNDTEQVVTRKRSMAFDKEPIVPAAHVGRVLRWEEQFVEVELANHSRRVRDELLFYRGQGSTRLAWDFRAMSFVERTLSTFESNITEKVFAQRLFAGSDIIKNGFISCQTLDSVSLQAIQHWISKGTIVIASGQSWKRVLKFVDCMLFFMLLKDLFPHVMGLSKAMQVLETPPSSPTTTSRAMMPILIEPIQLDFVRAACGSMQLAADGGNVNQRSGVCIKTVDGGCLIISAAHKLISERPCSALWTSAARKKEFPLHLFGVHDRFSHSLLPFSAVDVSVWAFDDPETERDFADKDRPLATLGLGLRQRLFWATECPDAGEFIFKETTLNCVRRLER